MRVPTATLECLELGLGSMVFAAHEIAIDNGQGSEVTIPGLRGTVRDVMPELSRAVLKVVEPEDSATRYLVVWSGDDGASADDLVARLFLPEHGRGSL